MNTLLGFLNLMFINIDPKYFIIAGPLKKLPPSAIPTSHIQNLHFSIFQTLREDATGAQVKMQADACAHQRAKSRKATLCSAGKERKW